MRKLALFAIGLAFANEAAAGDFEEPLPAAPFSYDERGSMFRPESDWEIQFRPYLWAADLDGTIRIGAQAADIDVSFSDYISDVDATWASTIDIRKKGSRWSFFLDTLYLKIGPDAPAPVGGGPAVTDITIEQALVDGWIGYRLVSNRKGWVDMLFGLRYQYLKNEIDLLTPAFARASGSQDWIDPHIGFRGKYHFNRKWYCGAVVDVGGFGVGSDLSVEAGAGVGYFFSECLALELSYRFLYVDYESAKFAYDVKTHGIFTGLVFYF